MLRLNHGMVSTIRGSPPDIVEIVLEQVEIVAKKGGCGIWKIHDLTDAFVWHSSPQGNDFWTVVYIGGNPSTIKRLRDAKT